MAASNTWVCSTSKRVSISPDCQYLAAISPQNNFAIFEFDKQTTAFRCIKSMTIPKAVFGPASEATIIRWGPQMVSCKTGLPRPHLLVSNSKTILAFEPLWWCMTVGNPQFGKLTYVNFLFDNNHYLKIQEANNHSSIECREGSPSSSLEISNLKFNDSRGLAISSNALAMILRCVDKEKVSIFTLSNNNYDQITFDSQTTDAQGILWSPSSDPLLVLWDSTKNGIKVVFFTAQGQAVKQFRIHSIPGMPKAITNAAGVGSAQWIAAADKQAIFVIAYGQKRIYGRHQNYQTIRTQQYMSLVHPDVIDGSQYIVWQESGHQIRQFHQRKEVFQPVSDASNLTQLMS